MRGSPESSSPKSGGGVTAGVRGQATGSRAAVPQAASARAWCWPRAKRAPACTVPHLPTHGSAVCHSRFQDKQDSVRGSEPHLTLPQGPHATPPSQTTSWRVGGSKRVRASAVPTGPSLLGAQCSTPL